mmetsp:Transcript_20968/g.42594  ORF Transcript_20968/g.42594 Transcript_20968/m.42594 type:complete len:278 (+) Transcript_20968:254-1087(+)
MGNCFGASTSNASGQVTENTTGNKSTMFYAITDQFSSIEEVQEGLRAAGLESSNLIVGVDFTKSNMWTGQRSFGGRSLHDTQGPQNPYQQVISIVGRTLEAFDDDRLIPAFGFGDTFTTDKRCFPFFPDRRPCNSFVEVLERYNQIAPGVQLAGPTNFAPIIWEAINIVKDEHSYHILVIIADGQVTNRQETENAIIKASDFPLSIVVIGVGDGPWDMMEEFDDQLPARRFDNFQFVPFNQVMNSVPAGMNPDAAFATAALMEIPEQFKLIRKLKLI